MPGGSGSAKSIPPACWGVTPATQFRCRSLPAVTTSAFLRSVIQASGLPRAPDAVLPRARIAGRSAPHSCLVQGFALVGVRAAVTVSALAGEGCASSIAPTPRRPNTLAGETRRCRGSACETPPRLWRVRCPEQRLRSLVVPHSLDRVRTTNVLSRGISSVLVRHHRPRSARFAGDPLAGCPWHSRYRAKHERNFPKNSEFLRRWAFTLLTLADFFSTHSAQLLVGVVQRRCVNVTSNRHPVPMLLGDATFEPTIDSLLGDRPVGIGNTMPPGVVSQPLRTPTNGYYRSHAHGHAC